MLVTEGRFGEVALSVRGQYSFDDRLIPQNEDVAGGLYSVRGYEESETAGDTAERPGPDRAPRLTSLVAMRVHHHADHGRGAIGRSLAQSQALSDRTQIRPQAGGAPDAALATIDDIDADRPDRS